MCRQPLGTSRETVPFSCFAFSPTAYYFPHPRLKKKAGIRCPHYTSPRPETCGFASIRERRQRLFPPPKFALPHQSVRVSVAIDNHHRDEPLAVQPPKNPHPVHVDFVVIDALISTDPALHVSRIPEKFGLPGLQKPMRQILPDTVSELDSQPRHQRYHHPIRCHRNEIGRASCRDRVCKYR